MTAGKRNCLKVTRRFNASAERVFDAWLDPLTANHWLFAAPGGRMTPVLIEPRIHGRFTVVQTHGRTPIEHFGSFIGIDRPCQLAFVLATDSEVKQTLVTVQIMPGSDGCQLTITHELGSQWLDYADRITENWTNILEGLDAMVSPDHELTISRVLNAPPSLVFRMWTEPEHIVNWFGPREDGRDFTTPFCEMDARPGGSYRICIRSPRGQDYWMQGIYREVIEPSRLVFTHAWENEQGLLGHETLVTVTFTEQNGKTKLTFHQATFESVDQRDSHREGWSECLDRLVTYTQTTNA